MKAPSQTGEDHNVLISAAGIFSGGARSTKEGLARGAVWGGGPEAELPGRRRSFQKICKKSMKMYNILKILKEIWGYFQFFNILSNFSQKFWAKI